MHACRFVEVRAQSPPLELLQESGAACEASRASIILASVQLHEASAPTSSVPSPVPSHSPLSSLSAASSPAGIPIAVSSPAGVSVSSSQSSMTFASSDGWTAFTASPSGSLPAGLLQSGVLEFSGAARLNFDRFVTPARTNKTNKKKIWADATPLQAMATKDQLPLADQTFESAFSSSPTV